MKHHTLTFMSETGAPVSSHLDSGFRQSNPDRQILPHEDVRIVRLPERPFHLVQLRRGKARPVTLLFQRLRGGGGGGGHTPRRRRRRRRWGRRWCRRRRRLRVRLRRSHEVLRVFSRGILARNPRRFRRHRRRRRRRVLPLLSAAAAACASVSGSEAGVGRRRRGIGLERRLQLNDRLRMDVSRRRRWNCRLFGPRMIINCRGLGLDSGAREGVVIVERVFLNCKETVTVVRRKKRRLS